MKRDIERGYGAKSHTRLSTCCLDRPVDPRVAGAALAGRQVRLAFRLREFGAVAL